MRYFPFFISLLILFSCENRILNAEKDDNIVVVFNNYRPLPYKTPGGFFNINNYGFFYVDSLNRMISYYPKSTNDTLILKSENSHTEVGVSYRNFEEVYFYLHKGDTVVLSMDSLEYPVIRSKHTPAYTEIYNLNRTIRKGKTHHNMEPQVWLGDRAFLTIIEKIEIFRAMKSDLVKDYCPLDTLKKMQTDYEVDYTNSYNALYHADKISDDECGRAGFWLKLKKTVTEREMTENKDLFYQILKGSLTDSLIIFPSYHRLLRQYLLTFSSLQQKKTKSRNNYLLRFDHITADQNLPPLSKNVLLRYSIQEIIENSSGKDANIYLSKYLKLTGDSALLRRETEKYNLTADAQELQLQDLSGTSSTLNELLNRYRGKLLYVDFWASWCAPCNAQMPHSRNLQKRYAGKDIVFLYLALNDTKKKWHEACSRIGIDGKDSESYMITNPKVSSFIFDLSIHTIPRYLLYDMYGKLINPNAPRPGSKEIIMLIDSYL